MIFGDFDESEASIGDYACILWLEICERLQQILFSHAALDALEQSKDKAYERGLSNAGMIISFFGGRDTLPYRKTIDWLRKEMPVEVKSR